MHPAKLVRILLKRKGTLEMHIVFLRMKIIEKAEIVIHMNVIIHICYDSIFYIILLI